MFLFCCRLCCRCCCCWWLCGLALLAVPIRAEPLQLVDTLASLAPNAAGEVRTEATVLHAVLARYPSPYQIVDLSRNRARQWVKTADNACIPWLRKTPQRSSEYLFSQPYMLESAISLVSSTDARWSARLAPFQDAQGRISLAQLLAQPKPPLLGIERNRSYGDPIDTLLHQHQRLLYIRDSAGDTIGSMLPMLHKGFVDLLLEYPKVAQRTAPGTIQGTEQETVQRTEQRTEQGTEPAVQIWPLQDVAPFNLVYFACSDTARGRLVVQALNQTIRQLAAEPAYQQLVLQNLPPAQHAAALAYWQQALQNDTQANP